MKFFKRFFFLFISPAICVFGLDFHSKMLAQKLVNSHEFGFGSLMYAKNYGAILGLYSDVPKFIFIISLSTIAVFLLCLAFTIFYFLPRTLIAAPLGLSLLISGILGNAFDRFQNGFVTDFLSFHIGSKSTPYMNIADLAQWVGYILLLYALTIGATKIWRPDNSRKRLIVNKAFQLKFCFSLFLTTLAIVSILGTFAYTFMKFTIENYVPPSEHLNDTVMRPFLLSFLAIVSISSLFIIFFGLVISLRIAGPLHAFELNLKSALKGDFKKLRLRRSDSFVESLEPLAIEITQALEKK